MFLHVPNHMVTTFEVTDEGKKLALDFMFETCAHTRSLAHTDGTWLAGSRWIIYWEMFQTVTQSHAESDEHWCSMFVCMSMDVTYRCDKATRHGETKKKPNQKQKNIEIHSMGSFDGNRTTRVNGAWCHLSLFLDDGGIRARLTCFNVLYQLI